MKKRLILSILIILSLISFVNASSKTYNYQDQNTNSLIGPTLYIYGCTDQNCNSLTSYWNSPIYSATSSIIISGGAALWNKEFHYINCFKVKESLPLQDSYYDGNPASSKMIKQTSCTSSVSTIQLSEPRQVGVPLTITTTLGQVFSSTLSSLTNEVKSFYDANVDVKLSIKDSTNTEVYTKTDPITIPFGGTTHQFTWTPTIAGDYTILVTTNVKDCKCTQPQQDSSPASTSITISSPPPTCTPTTCSSLAKTCGSWSDGCTGTLNCGTCATAQTCNTTGQCITSAVTQQKCSDNTLYNQCSTTKPKYCLNGNLIDKCSQCGCPQGLSCKNENCIIPACKENWQCTQSTACKNNQTTRICEDLNKCGTENSKPSLVQSCTSMAEGIKTESLVQKLSSLTSPDQNISTIRVLMEYKTGLPITIIVIVLLIAGFLVYEKGHIKLPQKPSKKPEKQPEKITPVKVTDLLMSIIDSLDLEEKAVANALIEGEGIRQDELRKKLGMQKQKFEIALQKLERRQIIKEREGENPRLFFNDWLK